MSAIIAMLLFAFTMSITPGPNNLIALSTGVNYGFKGALSFVMGVVAGFCFLLLVVGFGLGEIAANNPMLMQMLGYGGIIFICYLGYKIATSEPKIKVNERDKPGFLHGVFFQWLNPKAWIGALAGVSAFNLAASHDDLILFAMLYAVVILLSVGAWAYAGSKIAVFLGNSRNHQVFNMVMGASLILVGIYLLLIQIKII